MLILLLLSLLDHALTKQVILLHITILSAADNFERRMAIRRTYMPILEAVQLPLGEDGTDIGTIKMQFVCGQSKNERINHLVQKEAAVRGDIWQLPEGENYDRLPQRVVAALSLAVESGAFYLMKTDDDTFIHPIRFVKDLGRLFGHGAWDPEHLYYGRMAMNWHKRSIWEMFFVETEGDHPPANADKHRADQYAEGTGYILGTKLFKCVLDLLDRDLITTRYINSFEDVAMSEWLTEAGELGCGPILRMDTDHYLNSFRDLGRDNYIMMHAVKPDEMDCLYKMIEESGVLQDSGMEPADVKLIEQSNPPRVHSCIRGEGLSHANLKKGTVTGVLQFDKLKKLSAKIV